MTVVEGELKTYERALDHEKLFEEAQAGGFFSYVAGTVAVLLHRSSALRDKSLTCGIRIHNHETTLPMRKGLSSSAAVCVMIASCVNEVYGLGMSMAEVMEAAYLGEMATPSRCGRMDQCVAMGPHKIALMEFDDDRCELTVLHNQRALYFVVADLRAAKDTVVILRSLNQCFPRAQDTAQVLLHPPHPPSPNHPQCF